MLRQITIFISALTLLTSCNNENINLTTDQSAKDSTFQKVSQIDSVEIVDNIAEWPFVDSAVDSKYFVENIGKKAKLTEKLLTNDYEPDIIDTVRIVEWDSSYVETISNTYTKTEYLRTVRIADSLIRFKNDLRVGIHEEIIFQKFKQPYDKNKKYKYFLVTFGDGAENYLIFIFENQKVKYISFQPYTG